MGRYYLGNDYSLVPPEDLGMRVAGRRLVELVEQLLPPRGTARNAVARVLDMVRRFLNEQRRNGRPLKKELLLSLILDCVKSEPPMSNSEKEQRRKFKRAAGIIHEPGKKRVCDAKVCYRSELLWTLMFATGTPHEVPQKTKRYLAPVRASEIVAAWLIPLGIDIGVPHSPRRGRAPTKSEACCGTQIGLAAASIRKAYRRWNTHQAPNHVRGVYPGGMRRLANNRREVICLRSEDVIAAHQWR